VPKNGLLGTPRDSEISPRRVKRGRWSGVETGAFEGQGGASRLLGWADFSVVAIYVVKKGHARDIYFLLQTCNFWHFSAPSSLFTCCYLLASAFHRLYWLLSHEASIWSFCRSKELALV
jgi:hypothetical protein